MSATAPPHQSPRTAPTIPATPDFTGETIEAQSLDLLFLADRLTSVPAFEPQLQRLDLPRDRVLNLRQAPISAKPRLDHVHPSVVVPTHGNAGAHHEATPPKQPLGALCQ